jgi:DNA-binding NarL/FixJ family response regulator
MAGQDQLVLAAHRTLLDETDVAAPAGADPGPALTVPAGGVVPGGSEDGTPVLLLAEDNHDLRGFLAARLAGDWRVVEAADGQAAWELLAGGTRPDLILSDLMMPNLDGMGLLGRVRAEPRLDGLPFLFLTAWNEPHSRLEGLAAGAIDFVSKPFSLEELRCKLRSVAALRKAAAAATADAPAAIEALTERENMIARLVLEGLADKQIAERLGLSARTVSNALGRIYRKTGCNSRTQLVGRFRV